MIVRKWNNKLITKSKYKYKFMVHKIYNFITPTQNIIKSIFIFSNKIYIIQIHKKILKCNKYINLNINESKIFKSQILLQQPHVKIYKQDNSKL
jgi:hypothetical protein